jgi:hypothetical protein
VLSKVQQEEFDSYASISDPVLVECAPLDHVCFEDIINLRHELESESLDERVSKMFIRPIQ